MATAVKPIEELHVHKFKIVGKIVLCLGCQPVCNSGKKSSGAMVNKNCWLCCLAAGRTALLIVFRSGRIPAAK